MSSAKNNTQFGVCTWTLGIKDIHELMATIKSCGLNAVQYCEAMTSHSAHTVKLAAQEHGLSLLIYDPFDCRPPSEKHATIQNAVDFYKRAIDYAAELGIGQTLQGLSTWTSQCDNHKAAWAMLVECLIQINEYAQKANVPLSYEPCNLYEVPLIHTAEEYQALIDDSGCRHVSVLLDSFHMNIGEKSPLTTLQNYAHKNAIFHVSDSNREGIGRGHIPFVDYYKTLNSANFTGPIVFEFVLNKNPVNTPPRNATEMQNLLNQIKYSVATWKGYETEFPASQ